MIGSHRENRWGGAFRGGGGAERRGDSRVWGNLFRFFKKKSWVKMEKLPDGTERLLNRLGYILDRGVWRVAESGLCCPPAAVEYLERPDRAEQGESDE